MFWNAFRASRRQSSDHRRGRRRLGEKGLRTRIGVSRDGRFFFRGRPVLTALASESARRRPLVDPLPGWSLHLRGRSARALMGRHFCAMPLFLFPVKTERESVVRPRSPGNHITPGVPFLNTRNSCGPISHSFHSTAAAGPVNSRDAVSFLCPEDGGYKNRRAKNRFFDWGFERQARPTMIRGAGCSSRADDSSCPHRFHSEGLNSRFVNCLPIAVPGFFYSTVRRMIHRKPCVLVISTDYRNLARFVSFSSMAEAHG